MHEIEDAPETEEDRVARQHHESFNQPAPWRRVYRDGQDITDLPFSEWGWPFVPDGKEHGRRSRR